MLWSLSQLSSVLSRPKLWRYFVQVCLEQLNVFQRATDCELHLSCMILVWSEEILEDNCVSHAKTSSMPAVVVTDQLHGQMHCKCMLVLFALVCRQSYQGARAPRAVLSTATVGREQARRVFSDRPILDSRAVRLTAQSSWQVAVKH
jgi:hypothetical protein